MSFTVAPPKEKAPWSRPLHSNAVPNCCCCAPPPAPQAGLHVTVASPDKDFLQLLRPGLELLRMPTATVGRAKYLPRYTAVDFENVGTGGGGE